MLQEAKKKKKKAKKTKGEVASAAAAGHRHFSIVWTSPEYKDWGPQQHIAQAVEHKNAADHYRTNSDLGNSSNLAKHQDAMAAAHTLAAKLKKPSKKKRKPPTMEVDLAELSPGTGVGGEGSVSHRVSINGTPRGTFIGANGLHKAHQWAKDNSRGTRATVTTTHIHSDGRTILSQSHTHYVNGQQSLGETVELVTI